MKSLSEAAGLILSEADAGKSCYCDGNETAHIYPAECPAVRVAVLTAEVSRLRDWQKRAMPTIRMTKTTIERKPASQLTPEAVKYHSRLVALINEFDAAISAEQAAS